MPLERRDSLLGITVARHHADSYFVAFTEISAVEARIVTRKFLSRISTQRHAEQGLDVKKNLLRRCSACEGPFRGLQEQHYGHELAVAEAMKLILFVLFPLLGVAQQNNLTNAYSTITPAERVQWVIDTTVDPAGLLGHAFSAGFGTAINSPKELGVHWAGFEKRYVNDMATSILGNSIEAGVGALWGGDPRYFPAAPGTSLKGRLIRAAKWTVLARQANGDVGPAYARFIAIPASNAISNAWRPASETGGSHLLERTATGFAAQLVGNEWHEFWPGIRKKLFH
jgi:hypothetical protein